MKQAKNDASGSLPSLLPLPQLYSCFIHSVWESPALNAFASDITI